MIAFDINSLYIKPKKKMPEYHRLKSKELKKIAADRKIRGYSKIKRDDLITLLTDMDARGGSIESAVRDENVAKKLDIRQLRKLAKAERKTLVSKYANISKLTKEQLENLLTGKMPVENSVSV